MRRKMEACVLVGAVALGAVALAVVAWHPWPRHGFDRVRRLVSWPHCREVTTAWTSDGPDHTGWSQAQRTGFIGCEHDPTAGGLLYARFGSEAHLRRDLLAHPPSSPTCIAGREIVVDEPEPGMLKPLCDELGGEVVDGTRHVPDAEGRTVEEIDRSVAIHERRAAAAEGRALRRYWHVALDEGP